MHFFTLICKQRFIGITSKACSKNSGGKGVTVEKGTISSSNLKHVWRDSVKPWWSMDTRGAKQITLHLLNRVGIRRLWLQFMLILSLWQTMIRWRLNFKYLKTILGKEINEEEDSLAKHKVDMDDISFLFF